MTIERVGAALLERHEEVAARMLARIVDEIPAYRNASQEVVDDVRSLSAATAELLAETFAAGTTLRREYVPIVREQAARRVHQGVALEDFLHAYRVALFELWDACAEEAAALEVSRDESLQLARAAFDAIDTLTTHAAEAYMREESHVRAESGREARDLVERLIRGHAIDGHRIDLSAWLVVVVARIEATPMPVGDALRAVRDELESGLALGRTRPLVAIRDGEVVAIVGPAAIEQAGALQPSGASDVRYGVSAPAAGISGVEHAYDEARLALAYASAARPIASLGDLPALEALLVGATAATRAVIAAKGISPTADEIATIRAFADADMNVARAAAALAVHQNTVRYRLERIRAATGHDPRTFAGLVELTCVAAVARHSSRD